MKEAFRTEERHGLRLDMVSVTFEANNFMAKHPRLAEIVREYPTGAVRARQDLTIEFFEQVEDEWIKTAWEKARYVVENLACLWAGEHVVGWGEGYRSDDGFDYLTAAIDNVAFLTDIDLTEEAFREWFDAEPGDWGACDGDIRFMLFPNRAEEADY